tara:strand:+ start:229 stop:405 length:177 start_codon:yes stop_codon:yes gene_type:complete
MPIPTPTKDETKSKFITRCIDDNVMSTEYSNITQRIAICQSQWDNKDKKPTKKEKNDE